MVAIFTARRNAMNESKRSNYVCLSVRLAVTLVSFCQND